MRSHRTAPRVSRGKKVKAGAEAAAAAAGANEAEAEAAGLTAAAQAAAARKLAKKKKKIRYPKNYNPDNPGTPDPERWLPRRCVCVATDSHASHGCASHCCFVACRSFSFGPPVEWFAVRGRASKRFGSDGMLQQQKATREPLAWPECLRRRKQRLLLSTNPTRKVPLSTRRQGQHETVRYSSSISGHASCPAIHVGALCRFVYVVRARVACAVRVWGCTA